MAGETPFQTVGPFFDFALDFPGGGAVATADTQGARVSIEGAVLDGAGAPIPDALIEIWQANAAGRYHHPDDARELPVDPDLRRIRPRGDRRGRPFLVRHDQAWPRARTRRPTSGAAHHGVGARTWHTHAAGHQNLFR